MGSSVAHLMETDRRTHANPLFKHPRQHPAVSFPKYLVSLRPIKSQIDMRNHHKFIFSHANTLSTPVQIIVSKGRKQQGYY